jgi:hypothetical protein
MLPTVVIEWIYKPTYPFTWPSLMWRNKQPKNQPLQVFA